MCESHVSVGVRRWTSVLRSSVLLLVAALGGTSACSFEDPGFRDFRPARLEDAGLRPQPAPPRDDAGFVGGDDGGTSEPIDTPPPGTCAATDTLPCGPNTTAGVCELGVRRCVDGAWGECEGAVHPQPRDCASELDNDCDGRPDNEIDDVCRCVPGSAQPCQAHPGLDGRGICRAGQQTCIIAADHESSNWGRCAGSVGPEPADSCHIRNDDSNCDGLPNGDCTCVEGENRDCGPVAEVGICRFGQSLCQDGQLQACQGAVLPGTRNCASPLDNDCDGRPDNTIDAFCTCAVGTTEACDAHPGLDGNGACRAGTRTCVASADGATSTFGACTGAVGPSPRDCTSALDNDCDGRADNTVDTVCTCTIGTARACDTHPGLDNIGICRAGQQLCIAGVGNATSTYAACQGSVGPLPADSCTVLGDDSTCDGTPNGGCQCIAGQGNGPCSGNPAASRCDARGVCVACTANADCALVAGRGVCDAGVCVQCTATDAAACGAGGVCDTATRTCTTGVVVTPVTP